MDKKAPSQQLKAPFEKTRQAAHKRIVQCDTVQFRLDPDTMETLLQLSYKLKTPVSVLVRMWTAQYLNQELGKKPSLESRNDYLNIVREKNYINKVLRAMKDCLNRASLNKLILLR